jgi:hypothetical protein
LLRKDIPKDRSIGSGDRIIGDDWRACGSRCYGIIARIAALLPVHPALNVYVCSRLCPVTLAGLIV